MNLKFKKIQKKKMKRYSKEHNKRENSTNVLTRTQIKPYINKNKLNVSLSKKLLSNE